MTTDKGIEAAARAMHEAQGTGDADAPRHSPYQNSWDEPDSVRWEQWIETCEEVIAAYFAAAEPVETFTRAQMLAEVDRRVERALLAQAALTPPADTVERMREEPVSSSGWLDVDHDMLNALISADRVLGELRHSLPQVKAVIADRTATLASAQAPKAVKDVAAERRRQVEVEGWDAAHDDAYTDNELSRAAACYAAQVTAYWPWDLAWWKPTDRRRDFVKAAALIIADIERLDRDAAKNGTPR